jgi:hypothetical protein
MDIRYNSLKTVLESPTPHAVMLWGHDFHPTDSEGRDWPADHQFTYGGCGGTAESFSENPQELALKLPESQTISPTMADRLQNTFVGSVNEGCMANVMIMAKHSGNDAWLANKGEYHCQEQLAKEIGSCNTQCSSDPSAPGPHLTKDGLCPTKPSISSKLSPVNIPPGQACNAWSWNTGNIDDLTKYFHCVEAPPVGMKKANDCSQCVEDTFNPAPGSMFLKLLDLVTSYQDDLWFAHFIEIVQYLWNRKFTTLEYKSRTPKSTLYTLTSTNIMRDYPLTISFNSDVFSGSKISIDGKDQQIYSTKTGDKYYIKFKPMDNHTHIIEVFN